MALRRGAAALASALRRAVGPPPPPAALRAPAAIRPFSSSPAPEETIDEIRARIFGTHIGDGRPSGRKILRKKLIGPAVAAWYPPDVKEIDPFFVDVDDAR
jgi:small subunit ribosomal protein S33